MPGVSDAIIYTKFYLEKQRNINMRNTEHIEKYFSKMPKILEKGDSSTS